MVQTVIGSNSEMMRMPDKFISLILRHKPETIGITLDEHGGPDIYEIECRRMAADGYPFFESANHVWLTKEVPVRYLKKV